MKRYWMIFDRAGNKPFGEQRFDTFEDAWSHIYASLTIKALDVKEFEELCGEYYVERICAWEI